MIDKYDEQDYNSDVDDDADEKEGFAGFSILDESGLDVTEIKKTVKKIEEELEETIGSPIPQNSLMVILDNPAVLLPKAGESLQLKISQTEGSVYYKNEKIGDFKQAFMKRLYETRSGQYVTATLYTDSAPVMAKLLFSESKEKDAILIAGE